ncbi:MAG: FecR domain-containing protein [Anaerolineae bacterium]|nr:FecR domain-containing protein [Anaerolineae bacterium]
MRHNPERRAWAILVSAFTTFCTLAVLCPTAIYWYVMNVTDPLPVDLTSVRGIVLVGDSTTDFSFSATDGQTVSLDVNETVATDGTSQAIITFTDDSSLTLYGDTSMTLTLAREPRFSFSNRPTEIVVNVKDGRVRATASRSREDLQFDIQTPDAEILLDQGSYSVEVNDSITQVTTRLGQAEVINNNDSITLAQGERAIVGADTPLSEPLPAAQNLLADSVFGETLEDTWEIYRLTPIESITATAEIAKFEDQPVLRLSSEGQDNIHSEVGVIQEVNKDVRDFQSLRVFAEVRLIDQTLPGGGQLGSEFPIMLNVAYRDAEGNDRDWFHGFYYEPPPENYIIYNQPDNSSERVARFIWYPYESVNLLSTLGPTKPVYIRSIRIYASGWIYEAMVANISLLAEE